VLLRTSLRADGGGAEGLEEAAGTATPANPADPYMTLLGYFNSLRELGGSRRIVEDEVGPSWLIRPSAAASGARSTAWLFARPPQLAEPVELTSRVSTSEVVATKRRLEL
jgi:hypothetical protein